MQVRAWLARLVLASGHLPAFACMGCTGNMQAITVLHAHGKSSMHLYLYACRCASLLAAAGVPVTQRLHFKGEEPSLLMHFRVLEAFTFDEVDSVCSNNHLQS